LETLQKHQKQLEDALFAQGSFDLRVREFTVGGKAAICTYVAGYCDSYRVERVFTLLLQISPEEMETEKGAKHFIQTKLPIPAVDLYKDPEISADEVLRGNTCLLIDGFEEEILMDTRDFASRGPDEPEKDRTLRGPHLGLNENLISNVVQIRRYLRTRLFQVERFVLGSEIKNDVALLYLEGKADPDTLEKIRSKLTEGKLPNLSMTQETLANLLFPQKGLSLINPFPRVRYTERPDVIAATLMEGKIALICDNSPSVMLIPECIFDFFEEADDYYFPPITASYLRIVRSFVFLCSIFLIPVWLLLVQWGESIPEKFRFILTENGYAVPLFLQFLIIEIAIDGLRMASLNTPSTLSNSFSVIGGLLLGEYAIKSGWFVPQTILYSAFTGIANFIPTNYELGYSFKFMRISLILLVEFFGLYGFLFGIVFWAGLLYSMKSTAGKGYLYPFLPWDKRAVKKILMRTTHGRERETKG